MVIIGIVLVTLVLLAIWGIAESVKTAAFLTLLEIIGLLIIISLGFEYLDKIPETLRTLPSITERRDLARHYYGRLSCLSCLSRF